MKYMYECEMNDLPKNMDTYFWLKVRDRWPHLDTTIPSKVKIDEDRCIVFVDKLSGVIYKNMCFLAFRLCSRVTRLSSS